jgi:hypothetical protein
MLRQGPISRFLHGAIEYAVGVLLIAAPFLFGFESDAAVALSVVAGVLVLAVAASTEGPSSLIDSIPIAAVSLRLQRRERADGVVHHPRRHAPARDDRDALQAAARVRGPRRGGRGGGRRRRQGAPLEGH